MLGSRVTKEKRAQISSLFVSLRSERAREHDKWRELDSEEKIFQSFFALEEVRSTRDFSLKQTAPFPNHSHAMENLSRSEIRW